MQRSKIINNVKWIIACRIARSVFQLIIGMLSARYLGPANYGLINYAIAVTSFFVPIMQLGLQATLVQEYVDYPDREGEIIGSALVMNVISAFGCIIVITTFAAATNPEEPITIAVCGLYSLTLIAQSVEMLQYWFQARLMSKYSSLAMICGYLVVSAYKVYLLVTCKNVYWFTLSHAIEYGATGLFLVIAYKKYGVQNLSFSYKTVLNLFSKSKHYILATLMLVVNSSLGNVFLKYFFGEIQVGYYVAALTCTATIDFVFLAIVDTARPIILGSKRVSVKEYQENISRTYSVIIFLTIAQSIFFVLFSRITVLILYGESFSAAEPVLEILGINTIFSYLGHVRNIWILAEEKHSILFPINLCGAIASVVLNLLFIPIWGAVGAAMASVLTQIFTNFILGFIIPAVRPNNRLLLKGLNPKLVLEMLCMLKDIRSEKKSLEA